jgi:hypothetical protein
MRYINFPFSSFDTSHLPEWDPRGRVSALGETESGSAGTQPDKG